MIETYDEILDLVDRMRINANPGILEERGWHKVIIRYEYPKIGLGSYASLGLTHRKEKETEIFEWVKQNCGEYKCFLDAYPSFMFYFKNPNDAIHMKLIWC